MSITSTRSTAPTHQRGRRRGRRHVALLTLASLALAPLATMATLATAPAAHAAPPGNDSWEDATEVGDVPFRDTVDTTEATKDLDGPTGRYTQNSVWYHLVPERTAPVFLSARGTDYFPHTVRLFHADDPGDAPADWTLVAGDRGWNADYPAAFNRQLERGEHYYVMIGNDTQTDGGTAKIVMRRPARLSHSLARYGALDRVDGSALIRGTLRSTRPAEVEVEARLRQVVDGEVVSGSAGRTFDATTTSEPWKLRVYSNRAFKTGPARIVSNSLKLYDEGVRVGTYHFPRNTVTLR